MAFEIPQAEFDRRIAAVQAELARRNLDALIVFGNDCESHNIRYLADYWPAFESAGVLVPVEGEPMLLIGPESLTYAKSRSRLPKIRQLLAYRESSEPEYPGVTLPTFAEVLDEVSGGKGVKRLGMAASAIAIVPVYLGLQEAMKDGEIVKADDLLISLRMAKSEPEIAAIREAFRVAALAIKAVLEEMKPGMTELQVVGIAQREIYANGGEYEGHPLYVLSGQHSSHAIGRPTHSVLEKGQVIQLNIGAKVAGYTSSIGRAVSFGPVPAEVRQLLEVALDAQKKTIELIKPGVSAGWISQQVADYVRERGMGHALLYGPCHGIGLMECEHPWMETSSTYKLVPNMTFQVDSFLHTDDYGARFEDGIRVTEDGVEEFPTYRREVITL
ncbi:MAG: aminopeptidase P family protein [Anaerolineae bacterium]|nr:aminopeptidase P family protein [Anaerolineae bacterium]